MGGVTACSSAPALQVLARAGVGDFTLALRFLEAPFIGKPLLLNGLNQRIILVRFTTLRLRETITELSIKASLDEVPVLKSMRVHFHIKELDVINVREDPRHI